MDLLSALSRRMSDAQSADKSDTCVILVVITSLRCFRGTQVDHCK
jgi:hypothetical protein